MKVLSVRQPWSWMLVNGFGGKNIENRDWSTRFRGPLLIHAGKQFEEEAFEWIHNRLEVGEYERLPRQKKDYQFGGIIGVVKLVKIVTYRDSEAQENKWFVGDYGWCFERAIPLPFMPMKGSLGLFDAPPEIVAQVRAERERRKAGKQCE